MNELSTAIGIDIGGTKMALALVDAHGSILKRMLLSTEAELGFQRAVDRICESIDQLMAAVGDGKLVGIGIGCAGPLDSLRGLINNPYTLTGWDRCDIVRPLSERFQVPTFLENDADAAALGECAAGSGRGFNPVVMLTFGTGIGGGTVVNGEVYRGVRGEHPEMGHIPIEDGGPECYCGIRGCLESIASGTAMGLAGRKLGMPDARSIFQAASNGNAAAQGVLDRAARAAAKAAWTIWHTLLPERLVLGGGMMDEHFEIFAAVIRQQLNLATQFSKTSVSVAKAVLGNDAGIVGAATLALRRSRARL